MTGQSLGLLRDKRLRVSEDAVALRGGGYGTACASYAVASGHWYYELHVEELESGSAFRVGWSTGRSRMDTPLGSDCFSFALRSKDLGLVVQARRTHAVGLDEAVKVGDVIGCELLLPPNTLCSELDFDVENPVFPGIHPTGSLMCFFLNGHPLAHSFTRLVRGEYRPAVSLFGRVKVRFDFAAKRGDARPAAEMYVDQQRPRKRPLNFIPRGTPQTR